MSLKLSFFSKLSHLSMTNIKGITGIQSWGTFPTDINELAPYLTPPLLIVTPDCHTLGPLHPWTPRYITHFRHSDIPTFSPSGYHTLNAYIPHSSEAF